MKRIALAIGVALATAASSIAVGCSGYCTYNDNGEQCANGSPPARDASDAEAGQ